ncbi:ATP-dependent DNA helicase [Salinisphaera orenii]|uniref:ATP-dependent DNA helicase n=1 Tax=Salinisphaera orenii TaxID=856731 RepID=UPI000DBE42EC
MSAADGAALFNDTERFDRELDAFDQRPGQAEMANAVAEAVDHRGRLVVEAGTGTGKTLAYLLPALASDGKIIVATATRYLQSQLADKDLPLAERILGRTVHSTVLKGRANYLCLHRLEMAEQNASADKRARLSAIREWARKTESGDLGEFGDIGDGDSLWPQVTSTPDNCLAADCPFWDQCFVVAARREAQAADVVIANHHLFFADLTLRDAGLGEVLPGADAVILDEAHKLPDVAGHFFGRALSSRQIGELTRDLRAEVERLGGDMPGVADNTRDLAERLAEFGQRLPAQTGTTGWRDVADNNVAAARDALLEALEILAGALDEVSDRSEQLQSLARRSAEHRDLLATLAEADENDAENVSWLDIRAESWTWHSTPLDVASPFARSIEALPSAWVFTSATLAVGGDLGFFCARLGLSDVETRVLASPFDYANNALLFTPPSMPQPRAPGYDDAVIEQARSLITATGGGAFVLCTSYRAVERYGRALRAAGFSTLIQGSASRPRLLADFRADDASVLVATTSFWEGVDVRGQALRLVIIDKLPFASPADPVLKARFAAMEEAGQNPFIAYSLPQAVIALKQGVGRLIRDATDRGVLAICDPRLTSAGYGRVIQASLPPMTVSDSWQQAETFLRDLKPASEPINSTNDHADVEN